MPHAPTTPQARAIPAQTERPPLWRAADLLVCALDPTGRRRAHAALADHSTLSWCHAHGATALLDHAGPTSALFSLERPVSVADAVEPLTGRRARAMTEVEWHVLTETAKNAARMARELRVPVGLALDDDGLFHHALQVAPDRVFAVLSATTPDLVVLGIDDLSPAGIDATDGLNHARRVLQHARAAGVSLRLALTCGSRTLSPLRVRRKGTTPSAGHAALRSALWVATHLQAQARECGVQLGVLLPTHAPWPIEEAPAPLSFVWCEHPGYVILGDGA